MTCRYLLRSVTVFQSQLTVNVTWAFVNYNQRINIPVMCKYKVTISDMMWRSEHFPNLQTPESLGWHKCWWWYIFPAQLSSPAPIMTFTFITYDCFKKFSEAKENFISLWKSKKLHIFLFWGRMYVIICEARFYAFTALEEDSRTRGLMGYQWFWL